MFPVFLIFGSKYVDSKVPGGKTTIGYCTTCGEEKVLFEYTSRQFFSLFFLPIFPLGNDRTIFKCEGCSANYSLNPSQVRGNSSEYRSSEPPPKEFTCPKCGQRGRIRRPGNKPITLQCERCRCRFPVN